MSVFFLLVRQTVFPRTMFSSLIPGITPCSFHVGLYFLRFDTLNRRANLLQINQLLLLVYLFSGIAFSFSLLDNAVVKAVIATVIAMDSGPGNPAIIQLNFLPPMAFDFFDCELRCFLCYQQPCRCNGPCGSNS